MPKVKLPNTKSEWGAMKTGVERLRSALNERAAVYPYLSKAQIESVEANDKVLQNAIQIYRTMQPIMGVLDGND